MNRKIIVRSLLAWFALNARDLPWRRTRDPYAIWVSEIMLQQTQVKTVLAYWDALDAGAAQPGRTRSQPIRKDCTSSGRDWATIPASGTCTAPRSAFGSNTAASSRKDFDDILALPGIGRYTAGAICSIAFNQPKPILDGNVIRVLTRLYGITGNPRERETNSRLWQMAEALVLQAAETASGANTAPHTSRSTLHVSRTTHYCAQLNQSLMELGALICTPRAPRCNACPIAKHCIAYAQGRVHELPSLGRRIRSTPRRFAAFVAQKRGRFLVRQRPAGVVNAHLWEFPNVELSLDDADLKQAARRALGARPKKLEPLGTDETLYHPLPHHSGSLSHRGRSQPTAIPARKGRWLDRTRLSKLAFTSAHRQILRRLEHD